MAEQPQPSVKQVKLPDADQTKASLSAKQAIQLEVLKVRMSEGSTWVGQIIQVTAIFSALNVALYKFALDANSTPSLRRILSCIGIASSIAGFICCVLTERLRRSNSKDQEYLFTALEVPIKPDRLEIVKYTIFSAAVAMALNLAAWIYLLVTTPSQTPP
jgi:hypothetical protein